MTITEVKCDACSRTIEQGRTELEVMTGPLRSSFETIDLCLDCIGQLEDILTRLRQASE